MNWINSALVIGINDSQHNIEAIDIRFSGIYNKAAPALFCGGQKVEDEIAESFDIYQIEIFVDEEELNGKKWIKMPKFMVTDSIYAALEIIGISHHHDNCAASND